MFHVKQSSEAWGVLGGLLRELRLPTSALSPLMAHAAAVQREGDRLGLVSAQDLSGVVLRHTADSLLFAIARRPVPDETWADVGSGAGFPGLPLAVCFPETTFTLIEPQQRRAGFLNVVSTDLGAANVRVEAKRAYDVSSRFDVVVARALADPKAALQTCEGLATEAGCVILALGAQGYPHPGARLVDVSRSGVDSPGRLLIMSAPRGDT